MKELKLQSDLLKMAYNRDHNFKKGDDILYSTGVYDYNNYLLYCNKYAVYVIPENMIYIDINKIFIGEPNNIIGRVINDSEDSKLNDVIDTGTIKIEDKFKLHIFKIENEEIYVDEKLLKYFDFKNEISFKGVDRKSPVYVFEQGLLVGMVLPVKYW